MKQSYTEEELNILLPALEHAIGITIDVRKKHSKYVKMSVLRLGILFIAVGVILYGFSRLMDYIAQESYIIIGFFIYIGAMVLMLVLWEHIPFRSKIAVIDAINEYRGVFHRLEKDVPGIEPPVQLWSDRVICRRIRSFIPEDVYEKEYIPKDLKQRTLLAEKKLQQMKEQLLAIR